MGWGWGHRWATLGTREVGAAMGPYGRVPAWALRSRERSPRARTRGMAGLSSLRRLALIIAPREGGRESEGTRSAVTPRPPPPKTNPTTQIPPKSPRPLRAWGAHGCPQPLPSLHPPGPRRPVRIRPRSGAEPLRERSGRGAQRYGAAGQRVLWGPWGNGVLWGLVGLRGYEVLWGDRVLWVLWGYGVMGLYGVLGGCVLVGPMGVPWGCGVKGSVRSSGVMGSHGVLRGFGGCGSSGVL